MMKHQKNAEKKSSSHAVSLAGPQTQFKENFPVVGIGASAGGLEAFEQFFKNMPSDSGMAFVLISHLHPDFKSFMADILQRHTKMPVAEAEGGIKIRPDHVYIIPPARHMLILNNRLVLSEQPENIALRRPVDFFFRSLAQDRGENAICVILSGAGTEGTLGARAVKGEGGLVLAQDPNDAKYDGMPASVIGTGLIDDILPASRMPEFLLIYMKLAFKKHSLPLGMLQRVHRLIRSRTGYDFSFYKESLILGRAHHRMALHNMADLPDYVAYLANNAGEVDILFKELLIRVTQFFRDAEAFEALKKEALPIITRGKSAESPVRVWAPGCSTGEGAYSLAIILHEFAQETKTRFQTKIYATDIDSSAIDHARIGTYSNNIAIDVSPERLERYFIKKGNTFKVIDEIRSMVTFGIHNLGTDPPISRLDLVSCRNLLIYLGARLQKKVLRSLYKALNQGGVLFLGTSETIGDEIAAFRALDSKWRIFQAPRKQDGEKSTPGR